MKIATGNSVCTDINVAVEAAWQQIQDAFIGDPKLIICSASANYPADQLRNRLLKLIPQDCNIAGSSSCLGAMNERGFHSTDAYGLSLIAFANDQGDFGVGLTALEETPEAAASAAIVQAINDAERPGELPDLIWLSAAPGCEEKVLEGIASVVGSNVPVVGGSSGDNTITGEWWQFSREHHEQNGVLAIAFYPECNIALSFHSGYAPTEHSGIVTKSEGRTIHTIDHEPAASVYNRWTDGLIEPFLAGGNILGTSTFYPIGVEAGRIEHIPYYALKHPEQVLADGSITLFSNVETGQQITLMEGSPDSLTRRAGTVASGLMTRNAWRTDQLAGALVVYCAGCMLGVPDRMDEVNLGIHEAIGGAPFQAMFTFGEQGCFVDGVNRHANLMIAVVLFANDPV